MEVFVPEYDWNCQWESVEASVSAGQECGDFCEGDEFPGCWGGKLPILQLDIPDFVAAWNTRASQAPKGGEQK